jgi:polysaccharide chain length determinant protein (PEP-CTERM system associated)
VPEAEGDITETIGNVLRIIVQRRWWILLAASCTIVLTNAVLSLLPNHFNSEATLLVVQQQVPERYVVSTSTSGIADALQAMTQEVLSRTRLQGIVDEFHLYTKEKKRLAPEQVIEMMRGNIEIIPLNARPERKDFNAFKISFTADNAYLAQKVTSRLTSLFIEENTKSREDQARNTTNFLSAELKSVEQKLSEQEARLRDYKMEHLGELPEQQAGNLAILGGMQTQLQNTMASLSRAQQQKVYLESLLNGYRDLASRGVVAPGPSGIPRTFTPLQAAQAELARLQAARDTLLEQYTPQYPDVVRLERDIAKKKAQVETLAKAKVLPDSETKTPAVAASEGEDAAITQLRSQIEANRMEIESLDKDEKRLKASVVEYQARINSTPVREQQLSEVLRDYDLLKKNYADLLSKQQSSQLAANLEKQQEGQQFRLVDPPSLPAVPSGPKRLKMSLGGMGAGLFLGLALAFVMDMKSASFHTEQQLTKQFGPAMVLGIPLLLTPAEEKKRIWRRSFEWAAGSVLVLVVCVAELYVYRLGG